jgi:hypothetical protein
MERRALDLANTHASDFAVKRFLFFCLAVLLLDHESLAQ